MIRTCVRLARRFIRKLQTVAVWVKDAVCSVFDRRPRVKFSNWYGKMTAQSLQSFFMNPYLPETFRNFRLSTYRPQIEFFSVEGPVAAVRKSNAALKVFYTGEDVVKNFTDYSHECIGLCDVSIGFSLDRCGENYVRFPIWHYHHFNTFDKDEILQQIRAINAFRIKKEKFCALIAHHDGAVGNNTGGGGIAMQFGNKFINSKYNSLPGSYEDANHNNIPDKIEDTVAELGLEAGEILKDWTGIRFCFVVAPDGNAVELHE